jgi:hypothetical protein
VKRHGIDDCFPSFAAGVILSKAEHSNKKCRLELINPGFLPLAVEQTDVKTAISRVDPSVTSGPQDIFVSQYKLNQSIVAPMLLFVSRNQSKGSTALPLDYRFVIEETGEVYGFRCSWGGEDNGRL